jgi:phosphatidate phosphatase PAH1
MADKQIPNERRLYEYKSVYPEKSIIIDGVDVSGCKWFTHNQLCECAIKPADDFHCHANPNCHYKKWQYKEQECNRLKEEVSLLKESNSKLQQIEDVNSLEKYYLQQIDQLKAEIDELKKSSCKFKNYCTCDIEKFLQILIEIKETAKKYNNAHLTHLGEQQYCCKDILQKIREVIPDES